MDFKPIPLLYHSSHHINHLSHFLSSFVDNAYICSYQLKINTMRNSEKKEVKSNEILKRFKHLDEYCEISFNGLDDEGIYLLTKIKFDDGVSINMQSDVGQNSSTLFYATKFTSTSDNIFDLSIDEDLIDNIIISFKTNKEIVLTAFDTIKKVNTHIQKIQSYTNEYITNLLIGKSVLDLSNSFINEIKTVTAVVDLMQKNTNK